MNNWLSGWWIILCSLHRPNESQKGQKQLSVVAVAGFFRVLIHSGSLTSSFSRGISAKQILPVALESLLHTRAQKHNYYSISCQCQGDVEFLSMGSNWGSCWHQLHQPRLPNLIPEIEDQKSQWNDSQILRTSRTTIQTKLACHPPHTSR